jgi:hypothetical protein
MKRCFLFALVLVGCSEPAVTGDPVRKAPEVKVANRQVASDPAPSPRNVTDVTEFEHCIADLADACEYRMAGRYQRANARVRSAMEQEIALAQAGRESRSAAERAQEMKRISDVSAELVDDIARGNRPAMEKNLKLAREFLALMRADTGATVVSRREDKGASAAPTAASRR